MSRATVLLGVLLAMLSGHGVSVDLDMTAFSQSLTQLANGKLGVKTMQVRKNKDDSKLCVRTCSCRLGLYKVLQVSQKLGTNCCKSQRFYHSWYQSGQNLWCVRGTT